ncbi:MAG: hypothetical protein ACI81R_002674 [Bradymonadia bacterium]|jgi:hypothetical protein
MSSDSLRSWRVGVPAALCTLALCLGACGESAPRETFYDFLGRADRDAGDVGELGLTGAFVDVRGAYLMNVDLRPLGDVQLELRVTIDRFDELPDGGFGARIGGSFHFPDEPVDSPPLATWESEYSRDGRFQLRSGRVRISADRSPIEDTAVDVDFVLDVLVLSEGEFCGQVTDEESVTFAPLILELRGTTFGGRLYDPTGPIPTEVPLRCPGAPEPEGDAGTPDVGDGDVLEAPVELVSEGVRADIGGRYWFATAIPSFPLGLNFIADITYREGDSRAAIDGTLRTDTSEPGAPSAATFSAEVDEVGRFDVVIFGLVAEGTLTVEADVALAARIVDEDTFCGAADGSVFSPLSISLEGTTFGAVRIADDATEAPDNILTDCPEP